MKKKTKVIEFTINLDVFDGGIDFCITPDRAGVINRMNQERGCEILIDEQCLGQCIRSADYNPLILIDRFPKTSKDWGVLQHEIFHGVAGVLFYTGIILDSATEEVWSNTIGYVTMEFYNVMRRYKGRNKNVSRK
jgi:hypothetical protein